MKGKKMKVEEIVARSRYDRSYVDPGLDCSKDPGMTKQSFKDECDLNVILKKYETTGQLPSLIKENPMYGDFSDVPTYQEAFEIVSLAHDQFEALDGKVRARFQNDPAKFLEFANNPDNQKEMVQMGLAVEKQRVNTDSTTPAAESSGVSPEASK